MPKDMMEKIEKAGKAQEKEEIKKEKAARTTAKDTKAGATKKIMNLLKKKGPPAPSQA